MRRYSKGVGLGLPLSYNIVNSLGGELCYASEPGNTTFYFSLPGKAAQVDTFKIRVESAYFGFSAGSYSMICFFNFAFTFNLRRYTPARQRPRGRAAARTGTRRTARTRRTRSRGAGAASSTGCWRGSSWSPSSPRTTR